MLYYSIAKYYSYTQNQLNVINLVFNVQTEIEKYIWKLANTNKYLDIINTVNDNIEELE